MTKRESFPVLTYSSTYSIYTVKMPKGRHVINVIVSHPRVKVIHTSRFSMNIVSGLVFIYVSASYTRQRKRRVGGTENQRIYEGDADSPLPLWFCSKLMMEGMQREGKKGMEGEKQYMTTPASQLFPLLCLSEGESYSAPPPPTFSLSLCIFACPFFCPFSPFLSLFTQCIVQCSV